MHVGVLGLVEDFVSRLFARLNVTLVITIVKRLLVIKFVCLKVLKINLYHFILTNSAY